MKNRILKGSSETVKPSSRWLFGNVKALKKNNTETKKTRNKRDLGIFRKQGQN